MAHEISRLLRAFGERAWLIEPRKAAEIVAMLEYRHAHGVRPQAFREDGPAPRAEVSSNTGRVRVVRLYGVIMPRAEAVEDISQSCALMTEFTTAFRAAEKDTNASAIVLDIDSPGGRVDLVHEAADMVWKARKPGRPIVAVANATMCSAAYWIGSQADQLVCTPSGEVGSIGVYTVHQDVSEFMAAAGVRMTYIHEGARKVEGNPFEPLSPEARAYLQESVRDTYDNFVAAVARGRRVKEDVVRADPETAKAHFGGGRSYSAKRAVALKMADSIESLDEVIARLQRGAGSGPFGQSARSASMVTVL